jgi:hypothetical protein
MVSLFFVFLNVRCHNSSILLLIETLVETEFKTRKFVLYDIPAMAILDVVRLYVSYRFTGVLSTSDDSMEIRDLSANAYAETDIYGIPSTHAQNKEDAFWLLGFVSARDRLFQMDLLLRHMVGRLAEVTGSELKDSDFWPQVMGFEQVAHAIVQRLPRNQKQILDAYAKGVNQAMESLIVLPPEFWLLDCSPSAWRPGFSLLVVLGMEESFVEQHHDNSIPYQYGRTVDLLKQTEIDLPTMDESIFGKSLDYFVDTGILERSSLQALQGKSTELDTQVITLKQHVTLIL